MELELGDFAATAGYLARDLAIVEELSPERTRVRAQLLSHLGTCAVEQGDAEQGRGYFTRSVALARADNDAFGLAFAAIGLGRVALLGADLAQAEKHAEEALAHLASSAFSQDDQEGVRGLIHQLKAEVHLARNATPQAVEAFAAAYTCFLQTSRDSVVEMARLLYGYARACLANGEEQQAAHLLREALQYLDASTAEPLRQEIEGMLRTNFQEAWLLHAISRLIGQQYMDFLLVHAGGTEFRGARQDVVILFSDLRGFTILTEQSAAEPDAFVTILNDYLRHMTRCIDHAGGIVCQFNGDGILAVFSLPIPRPADAAARRAVLAALLMQEELLYTVNGDAANTAARLEGLTKYLGASILLSEEVARRLPTPNRLLLRPLGRYRLRGKEAAIDVTDVMGEDDGSRFAQLLTAEIAEVRNALACFRQRQFAEADAAFTALALTASQAGNAYRAQGYRFLATKAAAYRDAPPPAAWDGTIPLE
jgi:class 3 adenylate cyclase